MRINIFPFNDYKYNYNFNHTATPTEFLFSNSPYAADEVSRICRLMCGRASPHREAYASSARLRLAPRGVAAN
jgi:hypothetical protein